MTGDHRGSRSRSPLESKLGSSPSPPDHASRLSTSPRSPPPHPHRSSSPPPPLPFPPPPHTGALVRPIASGLIHARPQFYSKDWVDYSTKSSKPYCKCYKKERLVIHEPARKQFPRLLAAPEVRTAHWATCRLVPCLGLARSAPTTSTRSRASRRCTSGTSPPCTPLPRRAAAAAPLCRLRQERDSIVFSKARERATLRKAILVQVGTPVAPA